jgi:hypothetical protein
VALGALVALSYGPATAARARFGAARDSMARGRDALLAGDAATASTSFARAEGEFIQAGAAARNPALRAIGVLPVLGRTPDEVAALADALMPFATV